MSVIQGPFVTRPSPVLPAVSSLPKRLVFPPSPLVRELAALLGPLVSPLLQTQDGALDLSKIPSDKFHSFQSFLITQVKIDGIAFNESLLTSYHKVLGQERYRPLLKSLFDGAGQFASNDSDLKLRVPPAGNPMPSIRGPGRVRSTPAGAKPQPLGPRGSDQDKLLKSFTAEMITVSPERFVAHHLQSPEGRNRLRRILKDPKAFSEEIRADLVKAIALAGRRMGSSQQLYRKINEEISVWNYTNTAVTQTELENATQLALEILNELEGREKQGQDSFQRYLKHPAQVKRLVGLEKKLQREITHETIQSKARFIHLNRANYDPKVALEVRLDELWLTLIDEDRWKDSGSLKSAENIAFLVKEIESYRAQLQSIKTPSEFIHIAEKVRLLLKGGLGVKGEGTWRAIKDFTAKATVPELFQGLPQVYRNPYDALLQYVEELHHATDMGESIELDFNNSPAPIPQRRLNELPNFTKNTPSPLNIIPNGRKGPSSRQAGGNIRPPTGGTKLEPSTPGNITPFQEAKTQLINGLHQTKRSLWYQYKQHRALSRGLSQVAQSLGKGDIVDIRAGQKALDDLITQARGCQSENQIQMVVKNLQDQLKARGKLHQALVAAEMEGTEQLLGLGQTILIILATRQVGRGVMSLGNTLAETTASGRLHQMAQDLKQLRLTQAIHRGIQNNFFPWRAAKGFALGSWLATAENALAVATDQVNSTAPHWQSWAFDALATGVAMGTITPTASYMGSSLEKNLLKRMMGRYFGSTRAPLHVLGDALAETLEEMGDASLRAKLDDPDAAIGFDQCRQIAMVSGLGGFTKTGLLAEMLRSKAPLDLEPKPNGNEAGDSGVGMGPSLGMIGAGLSTLLHPNIANAAVEVSNGLVTPNLGSGVLTALGLAVLGMAFHGKGFETSLYPKLDPLLDELRQDPENQAAFTQLVHQMAQHPGSWTVMLGLVKKGSFLAAQYLKKVSEFDENIPLRLVYFYSQEIKNLRPIDYKKILIALYLLDGLFEESKSDPDLLDLFTAQSFPLKKFNQLIVDLYVNLIESVEPSDLNIKKIREIYGHALREVDFDIKKVFARTLQRLVNLIELRSLANMIMVPASQMKIQFSGNARLLDGTLLGKINYEKSKSFIRDNRKNYIKQISSQSIYWVKIYYQNLNLIDSIVYPADRREEFLDDYLEATAVTVACEMANTLEKMSDPEEIALVTNLTIVELYRLIPREWLENSELEKQFLSAIMDHLSRLQPPHLDQALDVIEEHFPLDEEEL